jgi:hypothetical protein
MLADPDRDAELDWEMELDPERLALLDGDTDDEVDRELDVEGDRLAERL